MSAQGDCEFLVQRARELVQQDLWAAKAWLITARSLYPADFNIQVRSGRPRGGGAGASQAPSLGSLSSHPCPLPDPPRPPSPRETRTVTPLEAGRAGDCRQGCPAAGSVAGWHRGAPGTALAPRLSARRPFVQRLLLWARHPAGLGDRRVVREPEGRMLGPGALRNQVMLRGQAPGLGVRGAGCRLGPRSQDQPRAES